MKIAMIIDAWDPIVGGGQIHVKNICEQLIKNHDCKIDLYVRTIQDESGVKYMQNEDYFLGKLTVYRCGRAKSFFYFPERIISVFSIAFRIIKNNKSENYDMIHAHAFLGLLSGKIASIILKKPIIGTTHGANLLDSGKKSFYYFVEKFLLTQIHYDTLISVGSSFLKYLNVNKNIVVIPNGVVIEKYKNISHEKEKDFFKILFVGRFEWTKGIDILIESINLIDRKILENKKIQVHLIGYGYDEKKYKNLVSEKKLEKYIIFRGKKVGDVLIQEYSSSHLFILPSRTEGFGMTIIEAMASKTLVLATKCGGPEDIIDDGMNGFLVEKENPVSLKNKIEEIIFLDRKKIDTLTMNAYEKVSMHYTWEIIAEKIYTEYKKININK